MIRTYVTYCTAPYVPEPVCFNFLSVFYWLRFLFWPAPASAPIKKHGATSQPPHYEKFIYFLRIVVLNLHLINVETKKERSELQKITFSQKLKPEPDIQPGYGQNVAALAPQHSYLSDGKGTGILLKAVNECRVFILMLLRSHLLTLFTLIVTDTYQVPYFFFFSGSACPRSCYASQYHQLPAGKEQLITFHGTLRCWLTLIPTAFL